VDSGIYSGLFGGLTMNNFRLQKQLILAGLAVLLLVDLALAFYTVRMTDVRQNPGAFLTAQSRQVSLVKADIKRAADIQKKIPLYLKGLDEFEGSLVPAPKGYSAVSEELGEVAKKNHVVIDDQKFHQKEIPGRDLVGLEIETSITGDYGGIVRFLNGLQRSKSVYIVDSLQVETEHQASGQNLAGSLKVNLHLRTYFRKV
jgi:type IV pilus assembly protein PilO